FGGFSHRFSSAGGNYRRAIDTGDWPQIYPLGFLPLIEPIIIDGSASAGVRGIRSKWFWDANAELGHNHMDFFITNSLNVSLGLGGRFEHYSRCRNTTNGRFSARVESHSRVVFRGTVSTRFRAPALGQEYFIAVSTNFSLINGVFVPLDVATYPVSSPQARGL